MVYTATTTAPTDIPITKEVFGGKGAGLLDMAQSGLNVPEALVITTHSWKAYRGFGEVPDDVLVAIDEFIAAHPDAMFSVRSGAPVSMPGMMDTILNVGVDPTAETYPGSYRRFVTGWLDIVHGQPKDRIKQLMDLAASRAGDDDERFNALVAGVVNAATHLTVPASRFEQVLSCVIAVFNSWDTPRARAYRQMHGIPEDMGTGCVVQRMVMGTAPGFSGSGVMFTRDPATGEAKLTGEIAMNAQGEEVVSGEVTPTNIDVLAKGTSTMRDAHAQLVELAFTLEQKFDDVQDIEFTFESGHLYVLQTRLAKMSARARIVTACDLSKGRADPLAYLAERVSRGDVARTMVPTVGGEYKPVSVGLAASPGAISGKVVFRSTPLHKIGPDCILVAEDTSPDDFPKMAKAGGIYTSTGGFTCHSAVVARGIGRPAVVGDSALKFNGLGTGFTILHEATEHTFKEGDAITIDGTTGNVYAGAYEVKKSQPPRMLYERLFELATERYAQSLNGVWFLECAMGDRVALTLDPGDLTRCEAQIQRAERLIKKGKNVGFVVSMPGLGEDLITNSNELAFAPLIENFGADLAGMHLLGGDGHSTLSKLAKMVAVPGDILIVDLLDLLHGGE